MSSSSTNLREFQASDTGEVAAFLSANFSPDPPALWSSNLERILWSNPNRAHGPAGWVLENATGGVVGFLGNVLHPFYAGGAEVRAAATTAWCVADGYRSAGLLLAEAFMEQDSVELLFNTTANGLAGELFRRLGFSQMPARNFSTISYWIADAAAFARGAVAHLTGSKGLASAAGILGAAPLAIADRLTGRTRIAESTYVVEQLARFDDVWDECWLNWRRQLFTGVRSANQLSWRLGGDNLTTLGVYSPGRQPLGYLAVRKEVDHGGVLQRLRAVDFWADPAKPEASVALVQRAIQLASEMNCACFETSGLSEPFQAAIDQLRPRTREMSAWPYFIRASNAALRDELKDARRWHATGLDGDSPFSLI